MVFTEIALKDYIINPFYEIGHRWMLVTAGTPENYNMMTASWGGFCILWGKKNVIIYIRPSRYTYEFLEKSENFTVNFFDNDYKEILNHLGSQSGRDIDKMHIDGLSLASSEEGLVFAESSVAIICKKIYYQDLDPSHFLDPTIEDNYNKGDYHRVYLGEILKILKKT